MGKAIFHFIGNKILKQRYFTYKNVQRWYSL